MRTTQKIRKNFARVIAIQLIMLGMLVVALPSAPAYAADNNNNKPAQGSSISTQPGTSDIRDGSLPHVGADQDTLSNILTVVFGIIGAFAVLNITLSGLKYVTSAGNEQKAAEAKNGIVYSLVGLMIAISAEAIVAFVINGATKS